MDTPAFVSNNMSSLSAEQRETLLEGPAGRPPPGTISNFVDPPNLQTLGRVMIVIGWSLAFFCFANRIYTKAFIIRRFKISDCKPS